MYSETIQKKSSGKLPELSEQLHVFVNGRKISLPKTAQVNGVTQNEFYQIQEGDVISVQNCYTVRQIAEFLDVAIEDSICVNDTPANEETKVYENFTVSFTIGQKELSGNRQESVTVDYDKAKAPETEAETGTETETETETGTEAEKPLDGTIVQVIANGQPVTLYGKKQYVYVDIFDYINFDLSYSKGRSIVTRLNGRNADYMEGLKNGDVIEIYWSEGGLEI